MADTLASRNPATGEKVAEVTLTSSEDVRSIFERARAAQSSWALLSTKKRAAYLIGLREILIDRADEITELISRENGKPKFEALANELIPCVDMLTLFARHAPKKLARHDIPLHLFKHRKSEIQYWPLGVVLVISPWNYPFMLPFSSVIMALVSGNAVIHKPSELNPGVGAKIQDLFESAGFPKNIFQTAYGAGQLGAALIDQKPDKIFFTGSVGTGKKIMAQAAQTLTPVNLELGGKDPMIILADADLDHASSAAAWGGFSNSGQMCASVERIIVHESIADAFLNRLNQKLAQLRQGAPGGANPVDLGAITFEKQKEIYQQHLDEARTKNAQIISGGEFSSDRRFLRPTIVTGEKVEELQVYNEETFGPVVAVTRFKSVHDAIEKANHNRYGLTASIFTKNLALGDQIARQLEAGTVTINEVSYTAGLGETPWGGVKDSGWGRTHSVEGLLEYVNVRHVHKPRSRALIFKSLWWFPYTPFQYATFHSLLELYRRSWFDKIKAFPLFVWNLAQMLKQEKRL